MKANIKPVKFVCFVLWTISIAGCSSKTISPQPSEKQSNGSELLVVDCLLPGQIRKLGQGLTYLTQRRPIKTSAVDCEIRGGEYVSYDRADYKTALNVWLPLAKQNDPEAQTFVGEIYEKGYGLQPDYVIAAQWYKKAAEQGNSRAQINLGYLYEKGLGVDKDLVMALNWYRKASGLENEDIAFASTIETEVKAEYEDELNILRKELDSSQSEILRLESELENSRKHYYQEQKKLNKLQVNLNSTNSRLEKIKQGQNGPSSNNDVNVYEKQLQADTAKLNQQLKVVERLKADLNQHNNQLETKLKQAEQRSDQLSKELVKHRQEEGQLKAELVNSQTQLARANLSIAQLTDSLISEQYKIDEEKKELNSLKESMSIQNNSEVNGMKSQLNLRENELTEHRQLIRTLEIEKAQINNEKNELVADKNKTITEKNRELELLNSKLLDQNQNLEKQRSIIAQLELEKNKTRTDYKELEKTNNKDFLVNHERIKQLEVQVALREQALEKQRSEIQVMEKDKLVYQQKINQLQTEENQELVHSNPSIEMLEPPFTMTRSMSIPTVKLRSAMSHREITGRVKAPAGLLSFNVNGLSEEINDSGLFTSLIELKEEETLVKTVAVDKAGNKAELEFMLLSAVNKARTIKKDGSETNQAPTNAEDVDFGTYYALIIGNQNYSHFPNLDTPVNDVKTINKILSEKYGFKTTLVLNATRYEILSALNQLRSKLTEDDNLLIYYAGHGELDRVNLRGHWLPVDAEENNTANWISTIAITDILNAMSAKHILVVADSCYSGAMTRTSLARLEAGMTEKLRLKWLRLMSKTRSRTVLTSGGLKPVLDSGMNGHSIFANAFIEAISENNQILEGQTLYRKVFDNLIEVTKRINFKQEPQYAPIRHGGHEAGDFFLVARGR